MSVITDYNDGGALLLDGNLTVGLPVPPPKPSRSEKLKDFFLGTEKRSIITLFSLVLLIGVPLGFAFPIQDPTYPEPWRQVSSVIGFIYTAAWDISFIGQIQLSYKRKSVVGLNFDWQALNLVGFACYSAYMFALYYNPSIRQQYAQANNGATPSVQTNDLFFGVWATTMSVIILLQIASYERGGQKVSRVCWIAIVCMLIAIAVMAACAGLEVNDGRFTWLDFFLGLSYIKLGITVVKYAPQVVQNYRRKSTIGFSIENILLDITGGSLSLAQALMDNGIKGQWSAILGGNPAKFLLGLSSIFYDIIFITQHYCLYQKNNKHILAIEEAQREARKRGLMVGEIYVPSLLVVGGSNSAHGGAGVGGGNTSSAASTASGKLNINGSASVGGGDGHSYGQSGWEEDAYGSQEEGAPMMVDYR